MNNIGLIKAKNLDAEHFTTDAGIKIRKFINPLIRAGAKMTVPENVMVVSYPKLEKDTPYIFACGHSYPGEIAVNISVLDRNAYVLLGTTDQIDHNPAMYFAWLNGLIYVNKLDATSRKESMKKMKRILTSNTSVMLYPEGVLNNTENLYCNKVYPGFYHLAQETGAKVVPLVSHKITNTQNVFVKADNPIDFSSKGKKESLIELRDALSTLRYELSQNEEFLTREQLQGDIHLEHMKRRKKVYDEVLWNKDVWDEEIMFYDDKETTNFEDVWKCLDNIQITKDNAYILAPLLAEKQRRENYDFKTYMKKNWNKKN